MGRYILKRLLIAVVVFFGVTIIAYVLATLMPGSPLDYLVTVESGMSKEEIAAIEHQMGLDRPIYIQYFFWVKNLLTGNFGVSYIQHRPVLDIMLERLGPTLILSGSAMLVALLIAIPLGMIAGYKSYSGWDYSSTFVALVGQAAPNFFVAILLIYVFVVKLGIFPLSGMYSSGGLTGSFGDLLLHLCLPCLALAFQHLGIYTRQMRNSMMECLSDDYVRTARSKGLRERVVLFKHTLRNALLPLVAQVGLSLAQLAGGAIITEQIFSWPGMGTLMIKAIEGRDYPVIMGITVLISAVVLIGNIVVDIIYRMLDPRIDDKR
jgi:peptide/nickel transport system permease protein